MTRRDYGPKGCLEKSGALIGALGIGAFMFGLMGKATFHVTTWALRRIEDRRASHLR